MVAPRWRPFAEPTNLELLVRAKIAERRDGPPLRKKLDEVLQSIVRMPAPTWCESLTPDMVVRPFLDYDEYLPSCPPQHEIDSKESFLEEQVSNVFQ